MSDRLFDHFHHNLLCPFLIKRRDDIDRSRRFEQPGDMLIHIDDALLLDIQDIEDSMCTGSSTIINRNHHMFFFGDDLVELGVVEAVVSVFSFSVGGLEVGEDLGLARDFEH